MDLLGDEFSSTLLWQIAITLGLGLLVGLERERAGKEVGLRTFSFVALSGFITYQMGLPFAIANLAFVGIVVLVINVRAMQKGAGIEATTSVCLFLVALVGMMVSTGTLFLPVAVITFMLLLLSWKEEMVSFSEALKRNEIHAAITLALFTFVILPVLPSGALDPWGLFSPRGVWLMVVMISAIGFANYILLRLYGFKGITYTGFLGGLVNSTATAAELAHRARQDPGMADSAFRGIMLAKTAAFLRNGVILALFAPSALPFGMVPVGLMMIVTLGLALSRRSRVETETVDLKLESPFSLRSALTFGLFFLGISVVGGIAQQVSGDFGFYAVSFAGGIVSSSSTAATAANLVAGNHITPLVAGSGVVLASLSSSWVIIPVVWKSAGTGAMVRRMTLAVLGVTVASVIGILLNPYLLEQVAFVEALIPE